jgi:hypothetical protein
VLEFHLSINGDERLRSTDHWFDTSNSLLLLLDMRIVLFDPVICGDLFFIDLQQRSFHLFDWLLDDAFMVSDDW